jgi:hypothetical protein
MKTKNILIYGAIAAGAYLAYRFLNAEIKGKRFANADGTIGGTFTTGGSGTSGSFNQFDIFVDAYVRQNKIPSYIWKSCANKVRLEYAKQVKEGKLMSNMAMQQMFLICVNQKIMQMQMQANLGSSSVRNTATM